MEMEWQEVRLLYPNQFVKLQVLKSHLQGDQEIIEEVAVIETVSDEDATRELLQSKGDQLVYHTNHKEIVLKVRGTIGLRGNFRYAD
jgi:formylmethanofuran dehydrogenase subunit D